MCANRDLAADVALYASLDPFYRYGLVGRCFHKQLPFSSRYFNWCSLAEPRIKSSPVAVTSPPNGGEGLGKSGRKTASACDLVFVIVMVDVGARTATAQNSVTAITAGLILGLILLFIWLVIRLALPFPSEGFARRGKKVEKSLLPTAGLQR
jgi:hypothetical protein